VREWLGYAAIALLAFYPLFSALMWTSCAVAYWLRYEREPRDLPPLTRASAPRVSVVIPAFGEERTIKGTLEQTLALDYSDFEVIVVNDASPDRLVERVRPFLSDPRVRLVDKQMNEGKAMAVNDAVSCAGGEILIVLDADTRPRPDSLRRLVAHFADPTVAAVTGNPFVRHDEHTLVRMQAVEFASVIGLIRRTHQLWGHPLTVTGAFTAFRRSAFDAVGGFNPSMETEDIAITWSMQLHGYRIVFEPRAVAFVVSPETLPKLWRQRRRWATGLGEVLHEHGPGALRLRGMLPLLGEVALSITWAVGFVLSFALVLASWIVPSGGDPTPLIAWWGLVISLVAFAQAGVAVALAHRYDPTLWRLLPSSIVYVLAVWMVGSLTATRYTLPAILRGPCTEGSVSWGTFHQDAEAA
jgi:biofilm PGA synthesis N-glycosyltransferase PgaC